MKQQTAIEWLIKILELDSIEKLDFYSLTAIERAKEMEKDQLSALYLTLLLNTPDITKFDFEQWYKQNTSI